MVLDTVSTPPTPLPVNPDAQLFPNDVSSRQVERWIAKKRVKEALLEKQKSKRLMEHSSQRTLRATFESHQAARVQGMSTLPSRANIPFRSVCDGQELTIIATPTSYKAIRRGHRSASKGVSPDLAPPSLRVQAPGTTLCRSTCSVASSSGCHAPSCWRPRAAAAARGAT